MNERTIEERDLMTDTNVMFYRRKQYYQDIGMNHLFFGNSKKVNGMSITTEGNKQVIKDENVKGNLILVYEVRK